MNKGSDRMEWVLTALLIIATALMIRLTVWSWISR